MDAVQWVIVGGESGPGARPMDADWAREIRDDCISKETAFFFKQWGGIKHSGEEAMLDGKVWHEFPQLNNATNSYEVDLFGEEVGTRPGGGHTRSPQATRRSAVPRNH